MWKKLRKKIEILGTIFKNPGCAAQGAQTQTRFCRIEVKPPGIMDKTYYCQEALSGINFNLHVAAQFF